MIEILVILCWLVIGIIVFFGMVIFEKRGIDFYILDNEGRVLFISMLFWPVILLFVYPEVFATHILNKSKDE